VRLAHISDLPSPAELARRAMQAKPASTPPVPPAPPRGGSGRGGDMVNAVAAAQPQQTLIPDNAPTALLEDPRTFEDVVALFERNREMILALHLSDNVHLVAFQPGRLEIRMRPAAPADLPNKVARHLRDWTGRPWVVTLSQEMGAATLREQTLEREARRKAEVENHPLVRDILSAFPGAEIIGIKKLGTAAEAGVTDMPAILDTDNDIINDTDSFGLDD
jgi:DNA polymerase-3 subunit gamma/tau